MRTPDPKVIEDLNQAYGVYEEALNDKYFNGSKPGMLDYIIWPWFEMLPMVSKQGFVLNADGKLPKLAAWCQAMLADETVTKTKVPADIFQKFMKTMEEGNPNYDVE